MRSDHYVFIDTIMFGLIAAENMRFKELKGTICEKLH